MIAKQLEQIQVKTQEAQGVSNDDLVGKKHMMNSVQEVTAEQALRDKLLRQQNQYRILAEKQEHLEKLLRSKNAEVTQLREDKRHLLPTPPKKGNSRPANSPLITRVDRDKNGGEAARGRGRPRGQRGAGSVAAGRQWGALRRAQARARANG